LRRDLGLVSVENSEILSELVHEQSGQAHQAQRILVISLEPRFRVCVFSTINAFSLFFSSKS
jgi:hypothetical protein